MSINPEQCSSYESYLGSKWGNDSPGGCKLITTNRCNSTCLEIDREAWLLFQKGQAIPEKLKNTMRCPKIDLLNAIRRR